MSQEKSIAGAAPRRTEAWGVMPLSVDSVETALERIRPMLRMDGGDCEVVDVDEPQGLVRLRLLGECGCCPLSNRTLRSGIERIVKESVPGVRSVVTIDVA